MIPRAAANLKELARVGDTGRDLSNWLMIDHLLMACYIQPSSLLRFLLPGLARAALEINTAHTNHQTPTLNLTKAALGRDKEARRLSYSAVCPGELRQMEQGGRCITKFPGLVF